MKVFWAIIAVLVVATCVLLIRRGGSSAGPTPSMPAATPTQAQTPATTSSPRPEATPSPSRPMVTPSASDVDPGASLPEPPRSQQVPRTQPSEPSAPSFEDAFPTADSGATAAEAESERETPDSIEAEASTIAVSGADSQGVVVVPDEVSTTEADDEAMPADGFASSDEMMTTKDDQPDVLKLVTTEMADEALGDLLDLDELLADSLDGLDPQLAGALRAERDAAAEALAIAAAESNGNGIGDGAEGDDGSGGMPDHSMEMLINPAAAQAALAARREQEALVLSEEQAVRDAAPVSREADGTLLFAGRYRVPGAGTAADPYKISWELLTSVRRSYDPSAGRNELPQWLEELNGKHVQLSGFVLFPVMAEASDELLLMYNQWDGCCIGIPPTPYDAIEVRLKAAPRSVPRWAVNYGTLSGRFDVDPYIVSNWLLGLYLLDAAELELVGL